MTDPDARAYFGTDPRLAPAGEGRYLDIDRLEMVEFVSGLQFRPVVGERMMVNFVRYEPNTAAPTHTHSEEQVTFVIDGEFEFDLDGDVRLLRPGMAVHVPPGVPHGARTLGSTCFEVDVFAPPRRVLLEALGATGDEG
jgi:unsaturated pyranuronate lyase